MAGWVVVGRIRKARAVDAVVSVFWRSCRRLLLLLLLLLSFVDDDGVACREVAVVVVECCWMMEGEDVVVGAKADADARMMEMEEKNSFIVFIFRFY